MKEKLLQLVLSFGLIGVPNLFLRAEALMEDPTFSSDGMMTLDLAGGGTYYNSSREVIVLADGRIVVAGLVVIGSAHYFAIIRLNSNGTFDTTFDSDGYRLDPILTDGAMLSDLVMQSDGKLVAVGSVQTTSDRDLVVVRYTTDGSLDNSFGTGGTSILDLNGYDDEGIAIDLQADNKIVISGATMNMSGDLDVCVVRLNTNGTLDPTFNSTGIIISNIDGEDDVATGIKVVDGNRILISGYTNSNSVLNHNFLLMRFDSVGVLDNSFGNAGVVETDFDQTSDQATTITIQEDNKIILSGRIGQLTAGVWQSDFGVARYNENGTLDNSFSGDGKLITPMNGTTTSLDDVYSVIIDVNGKILLGGGTFENSAGMFTIVRLNIDGTIDNSFEGDGFFSSDSFLVSNIDDFVFQPDGKLMVVGTANGEFAFARYDFIDDAGIGSLQTNLGVQAYPNPSTGLFNLSISNPSSFQNIKLYNAAGDLIWSNDGLKDLKQLTIDIQNHADGFYFLHIISDVGVEVLKLSKIVGY
jgi:uncharacterized delta-60 repeat protein